MAGKAQVSFQFVGDASSFAREAEKMQRKLKGVGAAADKESSKFRAALGKFTGHLKSAGSRLGRSAAKIGKGVAKGLAVGIAAGAAAVAGALIATFKVGFEEVKDAQKNLAQTESVIKSTGGVAGVSSKQVTDLAGSLQGLTGATDDAIQEGANLLLTFTNVQNKAGKGNDIFTQSTKTMLDMSQALGQDTKSSAIQLGKALNDPIKGITALSRVGVSFTAGQKKTIKSLVESGDVLGAQKVILQELNKEFGGSAEAYGKTLPGKIDIAKRSFEDASQTLVARLAPAMAGIATWAADKLPKALDVISRWWSTNGPAITDRARDIGAKVKAAFNQIKEWWDRNGPTITKVMKQTFATVGEVIKVLVSAFKAAWPAIKVVFSGIFSLAGKLLRFLARIINGVIHVINAVIRGINLVKPGKDIGTIGTIDVNRITGAGATNAQGSSGNSTGRADFRAKGGPVTSGRPYVVGEQGPELFVPRRSGTIVPNGGGAGGGIVINVYESGNARKTAMEIDRILGKRAALLGRT